MHKFTIPLSDLFSRVHAKIDEILAWVEDTNGAEYPEFFREDTAAEATLIFTSDAAGAMFKLRWL